MRKWVFERLDDMLFPFLKLCYPGYAKRMPAFSRCDDICDLGDLRTLPPPAQVEVEQASSYAGARSYRFRFDSQMECDCPENRQVTGRLFEVHSTLPWVLIVPGFATGAVVNDYGPFQRVHGRSVMSRGCNVALLDLPYHMNRRISGGFSGESFFSPDLKRTVRAFYQAAADAVSMTRWLKQRGPVGLWGTSLGGCIAGLTATVEPDLAAVVLHEPLDNAGDVLLRLESAWEIRQALAEAEVTADEVIAAFQPVSPSSYQPAVPVERILFITPEYDRIIPSAVQERFWQRWGAPRRLSLPQSHVTGVSDSTAVNTATRFLVHRLKEGAAGRLH